MKEVIKPKKRIAVLVSGGGTNFQSIIDAVNSGEINGEIVVCISSSDSAFSLERASKAGIPSRVFKIKDYSSGIERDKAIKNTLDEFNAQLVVLAGYLGILTEPLISGYDGKIINIHPALLPDFGGKGYFGINVHRAVIAAKAKKSGATVHFVDSGTDTGKIILQESLDVLETDTPESLQERILNNIEHKILVKAIKLLCN